MRTRLAFPLAAATLALANGLAAAQAQPQQEDEPMGACVSTLASLLRSRLTPKDYPEAARKGGIQGTVWFLLTCNSQGVFEGSWVERGSGSELLDQAALHTIERVFPLGTPAPADCHLGHGFSVSLPMVYRLRTAPSRR
ncbi:MAG TPA: TonB family protein [Burkholderiales bacterium]|nr:TonB family protein [Burkholderiales bacterium]